MVQDRDQGRYEDDDGQYPECEHKARIAKQVMHARADQGAKDELRALVAVVNHMIHRRRGDIQRAAAPTHE